MEILIDRGIEYRKFMRAISCFPPHVQMNSFKIIKTAGSKDVKLEDIFSILNQEVAWSFLDFALLEWIVKKYGSRELRVSMGKYSNRLRNFRKRTIVSRLMCIWTEPNEPEEYDSCNTLIARLNIKAEECTLEELAAFQKRSHEKLLKNIYLSEAALVLFRLKPGSLSLTWIVWKDLVPKIREALIQCIAYGEYFKENNIICMELDGEPFMTMERVSIRDCNVEPQAYQPAES
jgi:hypothetical protein